MKILQNKSLLLAKGGNDLFFLKQSKKLLISICRLKSQKMAKKNLKGLVKIVPTYYNLYVGIKAL